MASKFSVSATIRGIDRITLPLRQASKGFESFAKRSKFAASQVRRSNNLMSRSFKRSALQVLGLGSAFLAIKSITFDSVKRVAEFNAILTSAGQKFGGIERGSKTFSDLEQSAKDLGATTEFTVTQAAKGLEFFATAGFNAQLAMKGLKASADFTTASGIGDLALVADKLSDSLGLFQLKTDDPEQFVKNLTRISDVIISTSNAANTSVAQFFDAMPKGSAGLKNLGIPLEQFSALVATLSDQVKGGEAGVAIRNIVAALASTTKLSSGKALKNLIGDVGDIDTGDMKNIAVIIDKINESTEKMGSLEKTRVLSRIFPKRTLTSVTQLLNAGGDKLRNFQKIFENSTGTTAKQAAIMRKELSIEFLILRSSFQALENSMTVKFTPAIEKVVKGLTKLFVVLNKEGGAFNALKLLVAPTQINQWTKLALAVVGVAAAVKAVTLSIAAARRGVLLLNAALKLIADTNPLLLAFSAVLFVTFEIIENLDAIKKWFNSFKSQDLSKVIRGNLQGGLFGDFSGTRFFGNDKAKVPGNSTASNDPSNVITLPQNRDTVTSKVDGQINVNFNNAPKNLSTEIVSGISGIQLQQSGTF